VGESLVDTLGPLAFDEKFVVLPGCVLVKNLADKIAARIGKAQIFFVPTSIRRV
jgi:hypothetical protein